LREKSANPVVGMSEHVRKYLIVYTLLSVILAIPIGDYFEEYVVTNGAFLSNAVVFFAVLTIYPSMIQLRTEGLVKIFRLWKPIVAFFFYVFFLSPVISFTLAPTFGNPQVGVGFVIGNAVPVSSAALGYVLIAGGSIELATALAVISLIAAMPVVPFIIGLYSTQASMSIPVNSIVTSVFYILVLPFLAGQLTRYVLVKSRGSNFVNKSVRPYLSVATMLSMFALVFVLVAREAGLMVTKPLIVGQVILYQAFIILCVLLLSLSVSWLTHSSYEDHQALAFTSVTKNQSVAAAIATLALGPTAALAPAIIPIIQPILAIAYIHAEKSVASLLAVKNDAEA